MNGLTSKRHNRTDIASSGLTVIVNPEDPTIDVVFVHGFTGHPGRTWTHNRGEARPDKDSDIDGPVEPPSKSRRLNLFSTSRHVNISAHASVYWPEDLLPASVPGARVLTYGYDTHIRHWLGPPVNRNTVYDIAWDFLVALETERRTDPLRPILFIAHSLGGIVVKEMLRRSCVCRLGQAYLHGIFESTTGIIFFGTPHAGADPRGFLQRIAESVIKAAGFTVNEQIVQTLLPSAERLRELRDEFGPMVQEQNWKIHSFQEQVGVKILNNHKVVEDTSSYLNVPAVETTEHIQRNHMDMCRFTGLDDVEYKKVASALGRMTMEVPKTLRGGSNSPLDEDKRQALLASLSFNQMDARQITIKNAHAKTCRWLLKRPDYLDWLNPLKVDQHHGFLWIKGKPGCGKSTLMKFLLAHTRRTMKQKIVLNFFFNARGDNLEKSTFGMYRSLLFQLIERIPALLSVVDSMDLSTQAKQCPQWSIELLKALFEQAVVTLGKSSMLCLIDALDECDEYQIRDMVSFFEHVGNLALSTGLDFHVCFSSRHYPHITIRKGLDLILEGQEGHDQDIASYIGSQLKIGHSKLAETIRLELQEKAAGVFMWVILVVEILNKEHDSGRIHTLRRKLRDIPANLHELFRDILTRDSQHKNELILCIQWVLFAKHPLRPEQLYFAILSGAEPDGLTAWDREEVTADIIKRFILDSSKGLAEITKSKSPTVQFIHESVIDFLLKERGLTTIWPELESKLEGRSHDELKSCCVTYMGVDVTSYADLSVPLPKASSEEAISLRQSVAEAFPLLEYAVQNVLHHADAAECLGVSQTDFLANFCVSGWVTLRNLFEKHEIRRYTSRVSILYILAEYNLSNLIRVHPSIGSCVEVEDERYGPPFFAALATDSHKAVKVFCEALSRDLSSEGKSALLSQYSAGSRRQAYFGRNFKFSKAKSLSFYVVDLRDRILLDYCLVTGIFNVDTKDVDGRTPLIYAVSNGDEELVHLLLDRSASINAKDKLGKTSLHHANSKTMAELLLNKGAYIDERDRNGDMPIHDAVISRDKTIVQLLLDKGADIDKSGCAGRTPLYYAVQSENEPMVQFLLDQGANIDVANTNGETPLKGAVDIEARGFHHRTPLSNAAYLGSVTMVRLLLDKDADIETRGIFINTAPLMIAVDRDRVNMAVVELLLDKGARIDARVMSLAAKRGNKDLLQLLTRKAAEKDKSS